MAAGHKPLERGQRLGKYRLERRLGRGGYCEVWKARDTVEDLWVALKIPHAEGGQRVSAPVLKEMRVVARLRHRHILPVKNADIIDGYPLLATELSQGTLADRPRPMGPRKLLRIICQVLEGLAYAHRQRVVHCDVTPGNIFLLGDRAALGDFGISLTVKGRMATVDDYGTPGYVAPEQAFGRPTYSSDCFSVALILYEYLTGYLPRWPFQWPFRGHERLARRVRPGVQRVIRRALAVDPRGRFPHAQAMLDALVAAAPEAADKDVPVHPDREAPPDWRRARRRAFQHRYGKVLGPLTPCPACGEPVDERMQCCPWCGNERFHFETTTTRPYYCGRCGRGMQPDWQYCPWCYGAAYEPDDAMKPPAYPYHDRCRHCHGRLGRFMRYCPWCRRKVKRPWVVARFPEQCGHCRWPVDTEFWDHCPWCGHDVAGASQ